MEDDDEEEIADYDRSSSVTGMKYVGDNQMLVSMVPMDMNDNNEVMLIDLETGKDKRVYRSKREDGELFMLDMSLDRSKALFIKKVRGFNNSIGSCVVLDFSEDIMDPEVLESDANGAILAAKMSPGGDYVFYSAIDNVLYSAIDNVVVKGKEPTNAMHLGIFKVDEEDDEAIMEAEDEDLENVGFGLYFYDGERFTLPIFMYDADQLYVNELKTEDYHVFEIEE